MNIGTVLVILDLCIVESRRLLQFWPGATSGLRATSTSGLGLTLAWATSGPGYFWLGPTSGPGLLLTVTPGETS